MMKIMLMLVLMVFLKDMILIKLIYMFSILVLLNMNFGFNTISLVSSSFGADKYSYLLVVLSLMIMMLVIFSLNNYNFVLLMLINLMMLILYMCFFTMNLMMFYIYFELSLLPLFYIIMKWGVSMYRVGAGLYMIIYTVVGSLMMVMMMLSMYLNLSSLIFYMLIMNNLFYGWKSVMFVMAFMMKLPVYMFHIWLPKAHVQAPYYGSMILAGIMLKLGGYGFIRFIYLISADMMEFNSYYIIYNVVGAVLMSLVCLMQVDMKMLVAYSSVVHMGMMISGLMTLTSLGLIGSLLMMIGHGFCSSCLFYMVDVIYKRKLTRLLVLNKGVGVIMSSLMIWWFMMCIYNFGAPISLNMFSEIMLIISIIIWDYWMMMFIVLLTFFSAMYSMYLFSVVYHGISIDEKYSFISVNEYLIILVHWLLLTFGVLLLNKLI